MFNVFALDVSPSQRKIHVPYRLCCSNDSLTVSDPIRYNRSGTCILSPSTMLDLSALKPHTLSRSALLKYCKYTRACTKGVLFRTSMYKMYVQETYCY